MDELDERRRRKLIDSKEPEAYVLIELYSDGDTVVNTSCINFNEELVSEQWAIENACVVLKKFSDRKAWLEDVKRGPSD